MTTVANTHFRAVKRYDGTKRLVTITIAELIYAIRMATGCSKQEAIEDIDWMLEDCFDVHYKGCSYTAEEVF
jgi:hypothetical protein